MKKTTEFSIYIIMFCLALITVACPLLVYFSTTSLESEEPGAVEYIATNFTLFLEEFQDSKFTYTLIDARDGSPCLEMQETAGYRYRFFKDGSVDILVEKYPPQYAEIPDKQKAAIEVHIPSPKIERVNDEIDVYLTYTSSQTWCRYSRHNIERSRGDFHFHDYADGEIMAVTTAEELYDMCDKGEAIKSELDEWASNKQADLQQVNK